GLVLRSPSSAISVPDQLGSIVSGVVGLDESAALVHTNIAADAPPPAAFVTGQPCSVYWGEKQAVGFTNPYGVGTLPYTPLLLALHALRRDPCQNQTRIRQTVDPQWKRPDRDHHRCVRRADHPPGREPVVGQPRPARVPGQPVPAGRRAWDLPPP